MGVLGWILFGLIVGVLAKLIMPGRDPGGVIITILLGISGALLGGWFGQVVQRSTDGGRTWDPVGNDFSYASEAGTHQHYDGTLKPWTAS